MTESTVRLGVVMDPIEKIKPYKDSTFAMLLAAQRRGWAIEYMELADLSLYDGDAIADARRLTVEDTAEDWFELGARRTLRLAELDVLLMRKDPPFDMEYVYATYLLERAELAGCLVVNRPASLRDVNEKAYTAWFPEWCAATVITRSMQRMKEFTAEHGKVVLKPLDGMGGESIFVVADGDPNSGVIFETLTGHGRRFALAQRYLPQIRDTGDKRILLIDGEAVPYCLARKPVAGEHRGNLAAGGTGEVIGLNARDREICAAVGPVMRDKGLLFVGLDVIGESMTEINVTSPTCIREIDAARNLDIAGDLLEKCAQRL